MRRVAAQCRESTLPVVHRVIELERIAAEWSPELRFLALVRSDEELAKAERLRAGGLSNLGWIAGDALEAGDLVVPQAGKTEAIVLYRPSDTHHALLLTNRCNSYCLMCSQPPTRHADDWLMEEALDVVRHIDASPRALGLTGGEPVLLGTRLRSVIDAIARQHPRTQVDVLTNGRLLADTMLAEAVLRDLESPPCWLVPLYGHADFVHDFVVQTPGAFEETIAGLLTLQEYGQPIQLRIVLIDPVLRILPELCAFIGRNLPFVHEVALMACEPTGFALANVDQCRVDLAEWSEQLQIAARLLRRHAVPYLFMNTSLCALPRELWPDAHRSISDWKNTYAPECERCAVRNQCCGLFAWHESGWKPARIAPIEEESA